MRAYQTHTEAYCFRLFRQFVSCWRMEHLLPGLEIERTPELATIQPLFCLFIKRHEAILIVHPNQKVARPGLIL